MINYETGGQTYEMENGLPLQATRRGRGWISMVWPPGVTPRRTAHTVVIHYGRVSKA